MDTKMTIEEMKSAVQNFCEERDWDQFHNPKDLAIGAVTESSELLEIFRFKSVEDCERMMKSSFEDRQQIADELADILFFVVRIAQKYRFDLDEAFVAKMLKNKAKYPVDKARGSNKKYTEL
jgi:NTP pyrophosphatase (non-canonical NTP hydrolase)